MRLDKYLAQAYPQYSRSQLKKMIESGIVFVNGKKVKSGFLVKDTDKVELRESLILKKTFEAEPFDLQVLYEDDNCLVIDKPAGLIVHPGDDSSSFRGTLANALLSKFGDKFPDDLRPGIVHRLDRDTSGVMVVAKNVKARDELVSQFKERLVKKSYVALVVGKMPAEEGVIRGAIGRDVRNRKKMAIMEGAKDAVSAYKVKRLLPFGRDFVSLLEVKIESGRTHQIRVHLAAIKHPVVGDKTYGSLTINKHFEEKFGLTRQFLHAEKIAFLLPGTKNRVSFKAKLPKDLELVLKEGLPDLR